jgi:Lon protease-like protein
MFPLGTVLMPAQLLPLHIFEPRYRELMHRLTAPGTRPELGVVLIERGREVGGGDQRAGTGTLARLLQHQQLPDGRWLALLAGTGRVRVVRWLPDDPFPQAEVEDLPDDACAPAETEALVEAEQLVREAMMLAAELGEPGLPARLHLVDDPALRLWQLCAAAPLGPLDRQRLLEAPRPARLAALISETAAIKQMLAFRLGGR